MHATLGALDFIGDGSAAVYTIGRNGLIGWFEGVSTRGEQVPVPGADGIFDTPQYRTGRLITLSGLVRASSDTAFEAALTALSAIPTRTLSTFTVTTDAGATTAQVRRVDKPDMAVSAFGSSGAYQLSLLAPDPNRYGSSHTFPTSGTTNSVTGVSHSGTTDAVPVLVVSRTSGSGGYTVTGPGSKVITVTTPLVAGHPHTIDLTTGGLYVDGSRVVGGISVFQPWVVAAGASVSVSSPSGTTLTVTVKDTYL